MFDCCEKLVNAISKNEIVYYPQYRGACYHMLNEIDQIYEKRFMRYCIFCGLRMPDDLYYEHSNTLSKEYPSTIFYEDDELPKEFQTDEWWKKRGL